MKTFKNRCKAIWQILSKRNFILIYNIEEFIREDGESGRKFAWLRRTDYDTESDFYTMKASICSQFGMQVMDENARIGNYLPKGHEWADDITQEDLKDGGWEYIEKDVFTGKPTWALYEDNSFRGAYLFRLLLEDGVAKVKYTGGEFSMIGRNFTSLKKLKEFVKVLVNE